MRYLTIVLPCLIVVSLTACAMKMKPHAAGGAFLVGGDISMLTRTEALGGIFRLNGRQYDFFHIFKDNGANCFRLRLFVNPDYKNAVINDIPYTLALARRIKKNGMKFILDLHYSDTWAAPASQEKPSAWRDLHFEELEKQVLDYTSAVIGEFEKHEVLPDIVQIGNEVTNGILWPDGKISYGSGNDEQWLRFTRLLKAAIRGVKQPLQERDAVRVMLHIGEGGDHAKTQWFFDNINKRNVSFDLIGLSYYPWWQGSLEELKNNLLMTARLYGKEIVVAETAYPYRNVRKPSWRNKKNMGWKISPEGQYAFLKDLIKTVRQTPDDLGAGVIYWYPEALPVDGLHVWNDGATALFDTDGNALPAIEALRSKKAQ